ncbi:TetR/AcrR family transcriptional regulator [Gordonia aichiensis]
MASQDRRTARTRRQLREAFISLVLEQGYSSITVEDITSRADLGRATFYAHYTDKDALFEQIVDDVIADMQTRLEPVFAADGRGFSGQAITALFHHAAQERDTYRVILRGEGDGLGLRRFVDDRVARVTEYFTRRSDAEGVQMRIDPDILARAWVGEIATVLAWWLESETRLPLDDIINELLNLSLHGRYWASGFDAANSQSPAS